MKKHQVIFFTGAGISVDSGIPTFQEQPGIRDRLSRDFAIDCPKEYTDTIRLMLDFCEDAKPNAAHMAIAALDHPVITMNVDRLHTKAGTRDVIEVHGVLPTRQELESEDFAASYDGIVLYGDLAPKYEEAIRLVQNLEYGNSHFIIIGTSFYTGISGTLHHIAKQRHAKIVIINDNASIRVPLICQELQRIYIKQ